jgi:hypothetical protein
MAGHILQLLTPTAARCSLYHSCVRFPDTFDTHSVAAAAPAPALFSIAVPELAGPIESASIAGVDSEGRTMYVLTGTDSTGLLTGTPTSHVHLQSHYSYLKQMP